MASAASLKGLVDPCASRRDILLAHHQSTIIILVICYCILLFYFIMFTGQGLFSGQVAQGGCEMRRDIFSVFSPVVSSSDGGRAFDPRICLMNNFFLFVTVYGYRLV